MQGYNEGAPNRGAPKVPMRLRCPASHELQTCAAWPVLAPLPLPLHHRATTPGCLGGTGHLQRSGRNGSKTVALRQRQGGPGSTVRQSRDALSAPLPNNE